MTIYIFSDFDGTATRMPGQDTVNNDFYKSLLELDENGKPVLYFRAKMKSSETVQQLFVKKFGKYNDSQFNWQQKDAQLLMSKEAVAFFHMALENKNIQLRFVTKNRADYVRELFKYQGFSEDEIAKMNIHDSNTFRSKSDIVSQNLPGAGSENAECIYVFDDSKDDYGVMENAVRVKGYSDKEIRGYNEKPGDFSWAKYGHDIAVFGIEKNYPYANQNRFHLFKAQYDAYQGDAAKATILAEFRDQLQNCKNLSEVTQFEESLKTNESFKIIATGQGLTTRVLNFFGYHKKTDSELALIEMIAQRKDAFGEPQKNVLGR